MFVRWVIRATKNVLMHVKLLTVDSMLYVEGKTINLFVNVGQDFQEIQLISALAVNLFQKTSASLTATARQKWFVG